VGHAIAPGANILLVEANDDFGQQFVCGGELRPGAAGVSVISMSWGSDDSASDAAGDQALAAEYLVTPSGHQGITFVAASGDTACRPSLRLRPNVLAVGGTDLNVTSSGTIIQRDRLDAQKIGGTTYSGGGGVSQEFPGRKVPDVALQRGRRLQHLRFVHRRWRLDHGRRHERRLAAVGRSGGHRRSRPGPAGQSTLNGATQTITALYAAESDFNDITTGSTQFESAGVGYDLATGLGSPKAN